MFTALSLELFPLLLLFSTPPHNLFRWKLLIPHSQASFRNQSLVQHFSLFSPTCLLPGIVRAQQVLAYLPAFFLWCPWCLIEFPLPPWTPGVTVGFSNGSTYAHISLLDFQSCDLRFSFAQATSSFGHSDESCHHVELFPICCSLSQTVWAR